MNSLQRIYMILMTLINGNLLNQIIFLKKMNPTQLIKPTILITLFQKWL